MLRVLIAVLLLGSIGIVHVHGNDHDHGRDRDAPTVSFFAQADAFSFSFPGFASTSKPTSSSGQGDHFHIHLLDSAVLIGSMAVEFCGTMEILRLPYLTSYSGPSLALQTRPPLSA